MELAAPIFADELLFSVLVTQPSAVLTVNSAATSLQKLQSMLSELRLDAENQDLQSSVDAVRAQFKQTSSQIGVLAPRKTPEKLAF